MLSQSSESKPWFFHFELSLDAKRLAATIGPPLDRLSATLHLKGGVLTFNPLSFGVAGGTVAINMSLNSDFQPTKSAFALMSATSIYTR